MNSEEKNIEEKLLEYINGELSREEEQKVRRWIEETPEHASEYSNLKSVWEALSVGDDVKVDVNKRWLSISSKINNADLSRSIRVWLGRVAAVFILAFLLGGLSIYLLFGPHSTSRSEISKVYTVTPLGSKSKVILSDNTEVWLNAGSTLIYPETFTRSKERIVELSGEAFFKVAKKKKQPFLVNAQGYTIKALGTSFNVKAYKDEKVVEATLVEGLVAINHEEGSEEIMLKPNQIASMDRKISTNNKSDAAITIKSDVNTELYTSWKDNRWIIRNEEMSSLTPKLERKFGVTIYFNDEFVEKIRFTGSLEDESLEQVLKVISYASPIDFIVRGKKVYLTKKNRE